MRTNDEIELFEQLEAIMTTLARVDFRDMTAAELEEGLEVVSVVICRLEMLLARLADEIRFRGLTIAEFSWFNAEAADVNAGGVAAAGVSAADVRRLDAAVALLDALPLAS